MLPKFLTTILKLIVQFFFVLQSILLLVPMCMFRMVQFMLGWGSAHVNPLKNAHPAVFQSEMDIITLPGYKIEKHQFQTQDQAKIVFWRLLADVPHKVQTCFHSHPKKQLQPTFDDLTSLDPQFPVILQHGLLDCSLSWFLHEKTQTTLPYILAKQGYDVWIGNNRGTKYSTDSNESHTYWDYNIDHLIQYDIPCMIDSILKVTGKQQLAYIGHSQGTVQFLTALDVHPQLHGKIRCFIGLGPLISLKNLNDHLIVKVVDKLRIPQIAKILGFNTFLIFPKWMNTLVGILSYNVSFYSKIIMGAIKGLCGNNKGNNRINIQRLGMMVTHEPGGASVSNVHHWMQIYRKGQMVKYDYGKKKNLQLYGSEHPPTYSYESLKNLPFKCYLFRGTSDILIKDEDFKILTDSLHPEKTEVYHIQDYAHLDYLWCEDGAKDFYHLIEDILQREGEVEGKDKLDGTKDSEGERSQSESDFLNI